MEGSWEIGQVLPGPARPGWGSDGGHLGMALGRRVGRVAGGQGAGGIQGTPRVLA